MESLYLDLEEKPEKKSIIDELLSVDLINYDKEKEERKSIIDELLSVDLINHNEEINGDLSKQLNNYIKSEELIKAYKKQMNEKLFDLSQIVKQMQNSEIERPKLLIKFLSLFDDVLGIFDNHDIKSQNVKESIYYLKQKRELLNKYTQKNMDGKLIFALQKAIEQIKNTFEKVIHELDNNKEQRNESNKKNNVELETSSIKKKIIPFNIEKIDNLYKELYKAIDEDNAKKITSCRGRLIRALKKHKKFIDEKYDSIKCLEEIKKLLEENPNDLSKVDAVLADNSGYGLYFKMCEGNPEVFRKVFEELYLEKQVKKIVQYHEALDIELKEHEKVLNERYSKEFLDQKGTLLNSLKMIPKAIGLSIRMAANSINQLHQAKSNRKKAAKIIDVIKSTGRAIATPAIGLGKFAASNWYSLYVIGKGYINMNNKNMKQFEKSNENSQTNVDDKKSDLNDLEEDVDPRVNNIKPASPIVKPKSGVEHYTDTGTGKNNNPKIDDVDPRVNNIKPASPIVKPKSGVEHYTDTGTGKNNNPKIDDVDPRVSVVKPTSPIVKPQNGVEQYTDTVNQKIEDTTQVLNQDHVNDILTMKEKQLDPKVDIDVKVDGHHSSNGTSYDTEKSTEYNSDVNANLENDSFHCVPTGKYYIKIPPGLAYDPNASYNWGDYHEEELDITWLHDAVDYLSGGNWSIGTPDYRYEPVQNNKNSFHGGSTTHKSSSGSTFGGHGGKF